MTASAVSRPSPAAAVSSERGRTRRSRSAAVALIAAVALATTACSSDSDATPAATLPSTAPTTAPTTPTTTSTTAAASPEEEVEQDYLKANAIFFEISKDPNPEDPRLAETRTDPNLSLVRDNLRMASDASLVARFNNDAPPIPSVSALSITGEVATLTSCLIDDGQQVRRTDQAVVDDDVVSKLSDVEMELVQGKWLVRSQTNAMSWPDNKGCDR